MRISVIFSLCILTRLAAGQTEYHPDEALNLHNLYRSRQGAANMKMMVWDQELAEEAAAYASNCVFGHDNNRGNVGENLYATSGSLVNATEKGIEAWYKEYKNYDTTSFQCSGGVCGHFTQIIWATSERLGCAAVYCSSGIPNFSNKGTIVICRYGPPGNWRGQDPFIRGSECSQCAAGWENCVDGLCATDDMVQQPSTTEVPTTIPTSTDPDTTSTTSTSSPTTTLSTAHSSGSTTTTTQEPTTVTGDPSEPNPNSCGCSAEYREELRNYRELVKEWRQKYEEWKQKSTCNN